VRKSVFFRTNIEPKKWEEKKAGYNFSRNAQLVRTKIVGKKTVGEKCEKAFFIFPRIPCSKMGGKNARNNFSTNTRIVRPKNVGEKIV